MTALRAWSNFTDLDSYDVNRLFPKGLNLAASLDPNSHLFHTDARTFDDFLDVAASWLYEFMTRFACDMNGVFSSDDEKEEFMKAYDCTADTSIVPMSWSDIISNVMKVQQAHKGAVLGEEAYNAAMSLQKMMGWNFPAALSTRFDDKFIPFACGYINQESIALQLAPVVDIFGDNTAGIIDLVMLYTVLVKKYLRTVSPKGYPEMFILTDHTRPFFAKNGVVVQDDDLTPYVAERFFRVLKTLDSIFVAQILRDLTQRLGVSKNIMKAYHTKLEQVDKNVKRVEYTNSYTWT